MRTELRSGLFFLGVSLLMLYESVRVELGTFTEPGPGFLPFCVGLALGAFSLVLVVRGTRIKEKTKPHSLKVILALAALFAYSLVLNTLGFLIPTFFLVGILIYLGERRRWWVVLGTSVLVTVLAYVVFGMCLGVYFPEGPFGL